MASHRPDLRLTAKVTAAAAYCLAGAVTGAALYFGGLTLSTLTMCTGKPQISGADTPSQSFVMAITLPCAWPSGDQLWLVTQVTVAGQQPHNEYYFYAGVKNNTGKLVLPITVATCADRQWYLIAVTPEQLIQLQRLPHTERMAYYGNTFDAMIHEYIASNVQSAHTCGQ